MLLIKNLGKYFKVFRLCENFNFDKTEFDFHIDL